jgi:putative hydrolase of the HAD superfamily
MTIQMIFFDMGGTIDTFRFSREYRIANVHLIRECLERAGITLTQSDEKLADLITKGAVAYSCWNLESNIELAPAEIWSRFFLKNVHLTSEALEPIGEELGFLYETKLYIREIRQEVPDVLAKIKEMGLKIGCISNTQSLKQVSYNLKQYGIIDYFDPIVLSSSYGRRKPDPAIFYYAARLANVPTGKCVYVGDKINRDILGAHRAGFRLAVQIKHEYDNGEKDEGATPDAVIQKMNDLLPILEEELEKDKRNLQKHKSNKVKALFFDAGDILYYRPHRDMNFKKYLNGKKLDLDPNFESERRRVKDLAYSGKMRRRDYYEKVLHLYGIHSKEEIAEGIAAMNLDDNTVEIIEGVPETINQLKENGFILGIITDTAFSFSKKLNWFEKHGFGHVWDSVISSKEIGVRKPSPTMYEKAILQTGVLACEAVFVGHKKTELDGARAVGLKTIAFNYEKDAVADYYVQNFRDLLKIPLLEK